MSKIFTLQKAFVETKSDFKGSKIVPKYVLVLKC